MTSCDEVKVRIPQWETVNTEFKSRKMLEDTAGGKDGRNRELAADLTSLANRLGGRIVFGVDNATKKVEEGRMKDRDGAAQLIANINRDLCSPPVVLSHEFVECPEGDLMLVQVQRRGSIPHAVTPARPQGQIRERTYFIRNNQGKQFVTDIELASMFLEAEYPELSRHFSFAFAYRRDPPGGAIFSDLPGRLHSEMPFIMTFQALKPEDIAGKDAKVAQDLVAEIFPYAALGALAAGGGWGERVFKGIGWSRFQTGLAPGKRFTTAEIPRPPPTSLLSKLFPDPKVQDNTFLAGTFSGFTLPPDSEILVESGTGGAPSSSLTLQAKGAYKVRVTYRGVHWTVGLPSGHPAQSLGAEVSEPFAHTGGEVETELSLDFGTAQPGLLSDYYSWTKRFFDRLEEMLSWERFVKLLPDPVVFATHSIVKEIRESLAGGRHGDTR